MIDWILLEEVHILFLKLFTGFVGFSLRCDRIELDDDIGVYFQGEKVIRTIQNVIGLIEGEEEPDRYKQEF